MKYSLQFTAILLIALISCQQKGELQFFDKIIGEWQLFDQPVIEKWEYTDGMYQSQVLVISDTDTTVSEEIRILEKDGEYFYETTVLDQNEGESVLFKLIESSDKKVVFENLEHDFPQRIIYKMENENSLNASIEGKVNGKNKFIQFEYTNIK